MAAETNAVAYRFLVLTNYGVLVRLNAANSGGALAAHVIPEHALPVRPFPNTILSPTLYLSLSAVCTFSRIVTRF